MNSDKIENRESRATSFGPRRSSIVASTTGSSPLHGDNHNAFIRYCEIHTAKTFIFIFSLMVLVAVIGTGVTFSRDGVVIGKKSSDLILSSGEGMIARINNYVINVPDAECKGEISSYPDGRYSATLLDIVSEDSDDDFFRPKDCKWLSQVSGASFENSTFPANLVGGCNAYTVATGYSESITIAFEGDDLLSSSSLKGMCDVDIMIRGYDNYLSSKCRSSGVPSAPCCPSRSIGNYAAALFGLNTCDEITDDISSQLNALLTTCKESFRTGALTGDCWDWKNEEIKTTQCPLATTECARYNAVYDIFNALASSTISRENNETPLNIARLLVPFNSTNNDWLKDLYYDKLRFKTDNSYGGATVVGYDVRAKSQVFGDFLSWDAFFFIPITAVSIASVVAQGHSLFAAIFVVLSIYLTFGITLFVVGVLLWISFIPFFSFFIVSIELYVGLGFFYLLSHNWKDSFASLGPDVADADRLAFVWHHTSLKLFSSAVCSSVSFFTAILFPIPSIKVFGLSCGIAILVVFIVANFFFPLIIIMDHRQEDSESYLFGRIQWLSPYLKFNWSDMFASYDSFLFNWKISILTVIGIATVAVGSYSFIMDMETIASAQLLFSSHPFERYDRKYALKFRNDPMNRHNKYDVAALFGVRDHNTIKAFDPNKRDAIGFYGINITEMSTQQLLYDLCSDMVSEIGSKDIVLSIQNVRCYPLFFSKWMQVPCGETVDNAYPDTSTWLTPNRLDCCGHRTDNVTYAEGVFSHCLDKWSQQYGGFDTGVWWDPSASSPTTLAVSIGMASRDDYSPSYDTAFNYWEDTDNWLSEKLKGTALHSGYFTANMELLRYQRGLLVGLKIVAPLSITVAAVVVMFMTRNAVSAFSFLFTVLLVLWAISGSLQILGEKFSLFTAVVAITGTGLACQSAALVSHAFCEAGAGQGVVDNKVLALDVLNELGPSSVMTTVVLCLSAICLLGGNNYYTFAFGATFILIVFYIILLPQWWNLLFLSTLWAKHPFGQTLAAMGLSSPPCCMYEPDKRTSAVEMPSSCEAAVTGAEMTSNIKSLDTATVSPFASQDVIKEVLTTEL